jgi:choline dehydrogenase
VRRRVQLAAAAPAVRASATPTTCDRSASTRSTTCPGSGEHLQDHLEVYIQYACTAARVDPAVDGDVETAARGPHVAVPQGAGATNHFEGGGFVRSNDEVAYPNLMFHFLPIAIRYDGTSRRPTAATATRCTSDRCTPTPAATVKITLDRPAHQAGDPLQLPVHRAGPPRVGRGDPRREEHPQPAGARPYNGGEISPGPSVETDEEILDWVAKDAETALHPSCTCRMGAAGDGTDAVIDPLTMGVHGIEGVRVVDASSMRYVTNGNIYAPVMMLAEKGRRPDRRQHPAPTRARRVLHPPAWCERSGAMNPGSLTPGAWLVR